MTPIATLTAALGLTIGSEFLVLWTATRRHPINLLLYAILVNALTEPVAMYSYRYVLPQFYLVEAVVLVVESVLLAKLLQISYKHAFGLSLLANSVSALLGTLL